MDNVNQAIDLLVQAAKQYTSAKVADDVAHLRDLELFVGVRQAQVMQNASMSAFISEITASAEARQRGITITCVGIGPDMPSAVASTVGQWAMGVLPVLARWRGKHSCLCCDPQPIDTQGGRFEWLGGPVATQGRPEEQSSQTAVGKNLMERVCDVLKSHRPAQRFHWLELYMCKMDDGSVEATCRLDNWDWIPGKKVLLDIAASWPDIPVPVQSSRQFAVLLPSNGDAQKIVVPTFLSRLFGRA